MVAVSSPGLLCDYISFCFCSWWEELFTFPQEVLLLKWENTLLGRVPPERPSPAWRKARCCFGGALFAPWAPATPPTQGAHTRSVAVPLGWVYSCPLQLHVVSAHRTSASKDYYFSSFYINYFLFHSSFVFTPNDARSQVTSLALCVSLHAHSTPCIKNGRLKQFRLHICISVKPGQAIPRSFIF